MRNKWMMMVMAFLLLFGTITPMMADVVDARRGGPFRSGVKKYRPAPNKFNSSNRINHTDRLNDTKTSGTRATSKRGFGSSLMRGLMIGGLAGLLFGSLFGNLGFLGNILGMVVNIFTLFLVVGLVLFIVQKLKHRRKPFTSKHGRWH